MLKMNRSLNSTRMLKVKHLNSVSNHTTHLYPSLSNLHVEDEEVDELMLHVLKDHVAHLHVLQTCQLFHGQDKVGVGVLLEPFLYTHGSGKSSDTAGKSPYKTSTDTKQANDPHKADTSPHRMGKPVSKVGR